MSGSWGAVALGTVGVGCSAAGLILWLAPRGKPARIAACVAGGVGLTGVLWGIGLDRVESRLGKSIGERLRALRDGPGEFVIPLLLIALSMAAFAVSLGASCCWFMEAVEAKFKRQPRTAWILACASIGAFGWAMTVLHLWGIFDSLWATDLFAASAPPLGAVDAVLTILDMTGLVASLGLPSRRSAR